MELISGASASEMLLWHSFGHIDFGNVAVALISETSTSIRNRKSIKHMYNQDFRRVTNPNGELRTAGPWPTEGVRGRVLRMLSVFVFAY